MHLASVVWGKLGKPTACLVSRRKPLWVVVMSATLDWEKFSRYFNKCPVLKVPGRVFEVKIIHTLDDYGTNFMPVSGPLQLLWWNYPAQLSEKVPLMFCLVV